MFDYFKNRRREALGGQPLSSEERALLDKNIPYLNSLSGEDRSELESLVRVFLAEKSFEGCGGLTLTDEIKLTIAGQACLLLLHRETDIYPNVDSILVYPSAYRVPTEQYDGLVVVQEDQTRLGESWQRGLVVLAWDHVLSGAAQPCDGQNVVLHEFAHQLDFEDDASDGAPALATRAEYLAWARVMSREFRALCDADRAGTPIVLDRYGATNPAEFFAVATEAFFERPRVLRARHPELYAEFAHFFRQDPIRYSSEPTTARHE